MIRRFLADAEATEAFGAELLGVVPANSLIFLHGNLGAGKTALVRGYLRAAGHLGAVKSPTYNIVEEYHLPDRKIYHFDLYRLEDPEELAWLGIEDYFARHATVFIEWPDKGQGILPEPDFVIHLTWQERGRLLEMQSNPQKN